MIHPSIRRKEYGFSLSWLFRLYREVSRFLSTRWVMENLRIKDLQERLASLVDLLSRLDLNIALEECSARNDVLLSSMELFRRVVRTIVGKCRGCL
jgi:hypothetical protein